MSASGWKSSSLPRRVLIVLALASVAQLVLLGPVLPDVVASNFDGGGEPRGWSSRAAFLTIWSLSLVFSAGLFLLLPALLVRLPVSLINVPHRDYWLAPERRRETLRALSGALDWMGSATLLLLMVTMDSVVRVNTGERATLGALFLATFISYMAFTLVWTVRLLLRFRAPRPTAVE